MHRLLGSIKLCAYQNSLVLAIHALDIFQLLNNKLFTKILISIVSKESFHTELHSF